MIAHDIIDNRKERLVDHINTILKATEMPMIQTNKLLTRPPRLSESDGGQATINGHYLI